MDVAEARRVDMRVYLRRADVRVAEKLLDGPYVRPVREHVRGEGMPEDVEKEKISAKVENGVLYIDIPKLVKEEAPKVSRQVEIS